MSATTFSRRDRDRRSGNWPVTPRFVFRPPYGWIPNYQQSQYVHHAFSTMSPTPRDNHWYMDTGATSHMTNISGKLLSISNKGNYNSVIVGNGMRIPSTGIGNTTIPTRNQPLQLSNVLVTPDIVKNLVSVRRFATDNWASVRFDPFGFSVNDLTTGVTRLRCNSSGELYPITTSPSTSRPPLSRVPPHALSVESSGLWHARLGHPGKPAQDSLHKVLPLGCNKQTASPICHACQLGKHHRLPFARSSTTTLAPFDIVHSDLWTSPVPSREGFKYYLLFLDDFTHYLWVIPLKFKSEVFGHFVQFHKSLKYNSISP